MNAKLLASQLLEDSDDLPDHSDMKQRVLGEIEAAEIARTTYVELKLRKHGVARLKPDEILCNDIHLPDGFNYHGTRLWVIGNEYGALGAVWASCEQDALDELVDNDLGNALLIGEEDHQAMSEEEREELACLGNADEPANLDNAWMDTVVLDADLIRRFERASEHGYDTLLDTYLYPDIPNIDENES